MEIREENVPVWEKLHLSFTIASTALFVIALGSEYVLRLPVVFSHGIYFLIILLSGYEIIPAAFRSVLRKRLDINFLMTVAAFGAFAIGQADEGAAVIYLFSIAEFLEVWASDKARASIRGLLKLSPLNAVVKVDGREIEKHVHDVKVGEVVVVKPGEGIPVDGIVIRGNSSVNQAAITGESVPVDKEEGSSVYSGTINGEGFLEIQTTRQPDETILSRVIRLIREAQSQKSPTESFVERFSKYYTPIVVAGAIFVAVVPPLIFNSGFTPWIYRALVMLVVSCPCALTISTPVSMVSSITAAARNGVLIKGGMYLERMAKTKMVIFDKTGTLSEGLLKVSDLVSFGPPLEKILQIAASLESQSEHPIAKAIVEKARDEKITLKEPADFKSVRGKGIEGKIDSHEATVGKADLFGNIQDAVFKRLYSLQQHGKTCVLVGTRNEVIGLIALEDRVKRDAAATVKDLRNMGFEAVIISGDNEETTRAMAKKLGIDHYHAGLLPEGKVNEVAHLKTRYANIAMIGDGVNDAPALASASVGIAMGALGSDVSIKTADVVLMQDDLSKLPYLARLSRYTLGVVKQNIASSILVKGGIAILAIAGLVSLALAVGVGDMGLSLAVILNAMRLRVLK
ncbi:MAG: cadmium-translocating P-type ATPase [Nitrososphaerales archaeon]|nr:cadmium-translocating P-type ATPase [Nitrososphaerales archaeon]